MSATYSGYRPPRCRIARPSAFSNASSWRARSASFRTSERELWSVNGSLRGLAEPQEVPEDVGSALGVLNLRVELQSEQRPVAATLRGPPRAGGAPPRPRGPGAATGPRASRVGRNDLRPDPGVLQAPPFAVGPLPPVVDDVHAHGTPVAAG